MDEWTMRWMDVRELAPKITISILLQFLACHTVGAKDTLKYKGLGKPISIPLFCSDIQSTQCGQCGLTPDFNYWVALFRSLGAAPN